MNTTFQQYRNAYPQVPYGQPPCAANGYGWHGNGYGWQLDPLKWTAPSSYSEQNEVVAEPVLSAQKVESSTAWETRHDPANKETNTNHCATEHTSLSCCMNLEIFDKVVTLECIRPNYNHLNDTNNETLTARVTQEANQDMEDMLSPEFRCNYEPQNREFQAVKGQLELESPPTCKCCLYDPNARDDHLERMASPKSSPKSLGCCEDVPKRRACSTLKCSPNPPCFSTISLTLPSDLGFSTGASKRSCLKKPAGDKCCRCQEGTPKASWTSPYLTQRFCRGATDAHPNEPEEPSPTCRSSKLKPKCRSLQSRVSKPNPEPPQINITDCEILGVEPMAPTSKKDAPAQHERKYTRSTPRSAPPKCYQCPQARILQPSSCKSPQIIPCECGGRTIHNSLSGSIRIPSYLRFPLCYQGDDARADCLNIDAHMLVEPQRTTRQKDATHPKCFLPESSILEITREASQGSTQQENHHQMEEPSISKPISGWTRRSSDTSSGIPNKNHKRSNAKRKSFTSSSKSNSSTLVKKTSLLPSVSTLVKDERDDITKLITCLLEEKLPFVSLGKTKWSGDDQRPVKEEPMKQIWLPLIPEVPQGCGLARANPKGLHILIKKPKMGGKSKSGSKSKLHRRNRRGSAARCYQKNLIGKPGEENVSSLSCTRGCRTECSDGVKVCLTTYALHELGERGSGVRARGEVQDFYELRDQNLSNGTLFEDPEFPADDSSLYYSRRSDRRYEWLRPSEICDDPQLFVEGYSRFDVQQGELGDCWLLAAVANLTLYRRLFFQIVPDDQGFDEKYAGIFHFRFWQYGRWIDVVIDDRLPTYRGQLIYLHSTEENEFWSALLEKAYAKLHGSYEALKGGSTCEAMEDFTGGVTEMYEMNATPPNLFKIIHKAYERGSLMGCSLEPDPDVLEAETRDGLIRGHAYSITRVKYVDIQTPNVVGKIPLLRLRNPWGNESEWNGPWCDQSPEWRYIPEHEKEDLGLTFDNDGEFWMSYKDFETHFDRLEICNLTPDSLTEEELTEGHKKQWEMSVFEGDWVRGVTAGGCRNYLDTFSNNPQYRITLTDADEDDDESKCTVIVALMQKNRRSRKLMGVEFLTIGFAIYYLPDPNRVPKPLDVNYFKYNASVARSPSFINLREVSCRFRLPPGTYCIVPSTFEPNEEGEFLLRVFSENKNNMEEHDDEVAMGDVDPKVMQQPPTAEEKQEIDQVREFFLKLAGEDMEVDWKELKEILDYSMRSELPVSKASVRGVEAGVGSQTTTDSNGFLAALVGLICSRFCKDVPNIVEPAYTSQLSPTTASSYESKNKGFSKDVCRSMVAMLDVDRSGKLGYEEFKNLWIDIRNWKLIFKMYDKDNSSALSGFELRQALNSAGYRLNNHILNILMHRYGNRNGELNFDDFMMCAVKLKTMIDLFKGKDPNSTNLATFSLEDWIETTLYA